MNSGLRARFHGGGVPQVGEVTSSSGESVCPYNLSFSLGDHTRDYTDRRVTPSKRVTSPTWGLPPPCQQALSGHKTSLCKWLIKPKNERDVCSFPVVTSSLEKDTDVFTGISCLPLGLYLSHICLKSFLYSLSPFLSTLTSLSSSFTILVST